MKMLLLLLLFAGCRKYEAEPKFNYLEGAISGENILSILDNGGVDTNWVYLPEYTLPDDGLTDTAVLAAGKHVWIDSIDWSSLKEFKPHKNKNQYK